ncbi:MAG: type II secretion system F family protein [Candidatus Ratteibacteria bacterium]|nr:type II secretion system F family protein [Candidatus Ratteibacteria bacterium]
MARYQYVARDTEGNRIEGVLDASSNIAVITRLRSQNLFPVDIQIAGEKETLLFRGRGETPRKRGRVNLKELAIFTRQASAMFGAGVSIIDTLDDLSSQASNRYLSYVLKEIKKDIQEGNNFSSSLSKYPKVFSPLYVALIRSGEESGNLAEVMAEIASNLEDQIILRSKVRQALSYPSVVFVFFIGVVSFVFLFLLPKFREIFQSFGAQLPKFTLMILGISQFLISALPFLLIFLFIVFISLFLFNKTPVGKERTDRAKIKFPIFGPLMLKVSLAQFSSSLATLLQGGVPIISALDIVSKTSGNKVIEGTILKVRENVLKGSLVGDEMRRYRIFPVLLTRMVTVGEETGNMEEMLQRTAKFFRDEVDATLNILSSIIEPVLIVCLGVVVGTVVIAIYLPIFNLAGAIR